MYGPRDGAGPKNLAVLNCWLPEYSPTFVSYSHADQEEVGRLTVWLRDRGVRVVGDWDLRGGDSLLARVSGFISQAGFLIVVLSPNSVESKWVSKELEIAMNRQLSGTSAFTVVPVVIEPCVVPDFLAGVLRFDLSSHDHAREMERLLDTLSFRTRW